MANEEACENPDKVTFKCCSCGFECYYEYFGKRPPFSKSVMYGLLFCVNMQFLGTDKKDHELITMNFLYRLLEDAYVIHDPFSLTTGHLTLGGQCCLCSKDICVAPVRINYIIPGLQEINSSDFRSPEVGISVTEPDRPRAQLLGLGAKWSPTNMLCILLKDLMQFLQSLSQVCQNQASERKALLAKWELVYPRGGGYSWEFLMGVCCSVLQILTRYKTKKRSFPHPFSDQTSKIHTAFFRSGL